MKHVKKNCCCVKFKLLMGIIKKCFVRFSEGVKKKEIIRELSLEIAAIESEIVEVCKHE